MPRLLWHRQGPFISLCPWMTWIGNALDFRWSENRTASLRGQRCSPALAEALESAKRPLLVIGGALNQTGGWYDGIALAEKLNEAVMAPPFEGRPGFRRLIPFSRADFSAAPLDLQELQGYDLVVVIGSPVFRYYPYAPGAYLPEGTRLILLTDSPEEVARAVAGDGIVCDPARACATLVEPLLKATRKAPAATRNPLPAPEVKDKITADYVCYTVAKTRPKNSVITHEPATSMGSILERLPPSEPRSFFCSFSGVLGYGLPAAIGVALAERDLGTNRKVISLQGDGATQYVVQALWNRPGRNCPFCS